ncbi:MAG: sugar phosphate isomerase/epimerase family protein [Candidatus Odinarchaeota archaeon]
MNDSNKYLIVFLLITPEVCDQKNNYIISDLNIMELGISTLGHIIDIARATKFKNLMDIQFNATEQCLNFTEKNGIEIIELVIEPPQIINDEYRREYINLINSFSIKKQIHAPYIDLNLCSYNKRIFEASIESHIEVIKLSHQIKAKIITIHPGLANFMISAIREYNKEQLKNAIHRLLDFSDNQNVLICLENMPKKAYIMTDNSNIEELYSNINRKDLYFTFDTSHFYMCDGNVNNLWAKFHHIIKNVHIVDNLNKKSDTHPPIGSGKLDFKENIDVFRKYSYEGPLIIELSSINQLNQSINYINKFL